MRGDREAIVAMLSTGPCALAIGTEQAEWWTGSDAFARAHRDAGGFEGEIVVMSAYEAGSAAWAAARVEIHLEGGRRLPARVSVVLLLGDARWEMMHTHASIPSDATS